MEGFWGRSSSESVGPVRDGKPVKKRILYQSCSVRGRVSRDYLGITDGRFRI